MSGSVNFVAIDPYEELNFKNPDRRITKISALIDFSPTTPPVETLFRQAKNCLEDSLIAVTLEESKEQKIEKIMNAKMPLIKARNKILDNPLKYLLPNYRKKLVQIDSELDKLDLALYQLEKENSIEVTELNEMVLSAQAELAQYSHYLLPESKNIFQPLVQSSLDSDKTASSSKTSFTAVRDNENRQL